MNEHDFSEDIKMMARQVAQMLVGKTPCERAMILHQAQEIWDQMHDDALRPEGARQADARQEDAEGTFMEMTAAWMGAVLHELPPSSRVEVLQLLSDLRKNAQFDRLTRDVDITGDS